MKVCAFYTIGTPYEELVARFKLSALNNSIKPYIKGYEPQGSWELNCGLKPTFIKECLEKFKEPILYVDIDATFEAPIDESIMDGDICLYRLQDKEVLSGTLYFKYNKRTLAFLDKWIEKQKEYPMMWDQRTLSKTLLESDIKQGKLPATYCKIFDIMKKVSGGVIVHHQASRRLKKVVKDVIEPKPIVSIEEKEEVVIPKEVRFAANGLMFMVRNKRDAVEYMDKHFQRVTNELKWYPKIEATDFKKFKEKYKNKICNIIGKGSSLDLLTQIDNDGPIICLNESIHYIEGLGLKNPIYCVQQDTRLQGSCEPKEGFLFVNALAKRFYKDFDNKYIYVAGSLGLKDTSLSVCVAIEIGKIFGCKEFKLYAFDACTNKTLNYAKAIGYDSKKYGDPSRFLSHHEIIDKQLEGCNYGYVNISTKRL